MTDFSNIFSGPAKSESTPQIHDRRTALSQSFPFSSTTGDSTTVESNRQRTATGRTATGRMLRLVIRSVRSLVCRLCGQVSQAARQSLSGRSGAESEANLREQDSTHFTRVRSASPISPELQSRTGASS
jgi:hypothetical protein